MRSRRLEKGTLPFTFSYDGRQIEALPGDTIAAALIDSEERVGRHTQSGKPRHVFCGMGVCYECLVIVNGLGIARGCTTKAKPGMVVHSWPKNGLPESLDLSPLATPPKGDIARKTCQLAVIGAGPGGIAAAKAAAECGVEVVVIDERPDPGGQFFKQIIPSLEPASRKPLDTQYAEGQRYIQEAKDAGCTFLTGAMVWRASCSDQRVLELCLYHEGRALYYYPEQLVIATGAYDEPVPVPGWTLPGVMTAGAAQTLVRTYGVCPPGPVLVAGSGPLILQVAYELVKAGIKVAAVVSSASVSFDTFPDMAGMLLRNAKISFLGAKYLAELIKNNVPLIRGHVLSRIEGQDRCETAVIAPLDMSGAIDRSKEKTFEAATVCQGYGLIPSSEIARQIGCKFEPDARGSGDLVGVRDRSGQSSIDSVYLVGESGGIIGAYMAMSQGQLAGWSVAQKFGHTVPSAQRGKAEKDFVRHQSFQNHLWNALSGRPVGLSLADEETQVCRCEEVPLKAIEQALAKGVNDMGSLKRLTRAGMGRCQGRYCGTFLSRYLSERRGKPLSMKEHNVPQPPLKPIPLPILAVEKKEWGGHKRSSLGTAPGRVEVNEKLADVNVLVIGAGIAGCSTAYWLAKEGKEALILDRGPANGQASGGNAGSMHVQLLSFDYGAKAESGGSPALKTLLLQREAAAMWKQLEIDLQRDFEIKTVGGLMVAENQRDLEFLERKTAAERSVGIDVQVIDAAELRRIAPAVSDIMIAAAFCPEEGKINPLVATQGVLEAALESGQKLLENTTVFSIDREQKGFRVHTNNGWITCRNIVNAAGAWSSQISSMVSDPIPVHGAPLQMIVTEPVAPVVKHLIAHADRHLTMKQANNGNFIIGGGWTAGWNSVSKFPTTLRDSLEGNVWVARRTVPCLDTVHVIRSWAAMNINIDGAPIVGEMPGVPGFYNTVTSNGYTLGPLMGRITSDLIVRNQTNWDISFCQLDRF